jgi:spore maturation protein CgeB
LENFDGVLAFGEKIKQVYKEQCWANRVWTWHEAADTRVFHPVHAADQEGDLIWIGNWGDEERTGELKEFFIQPVKDLSLDATAYGVRYPDYACRMLADSGIHYGGWLPNYEVPSVFAGFKVTVHIPRRPYVDALRGIPTIRPFEALACGIPLVCSPWRDAEGLFTPGKDFLLARDGKEMKHLLRDVIEDRDMAHELSEHGRRTILARHTCAHRVDELLLICRSMGLEIEPRSTTSMPAYAER